MLTVKQKLLFNSLKKYFNKYHKKDTVFSKDYCKEFVKDTIKEIYKIYPDKNVGKISINWYDEKFNRAQDIDSSTFCFEINFHDVYSGLPWLIARFFKGVTKPGIYLIQ